MTLSTGTFDTVIGNATPCSGSGCTWQLENWGAGWIFSPDYYPSGEEIFQTGAGSNSGSYSNPTNDANIKATNFQNVTAGQVRELPGPAAPGHLPTELRQPVQRDRHQPQGGHAAERAAGHRPRRTGAGRADLRPWGCG